MQVRLFDLADKWFLSSTANASDSSFKQHLKELSERILFLEAASPSQSWPLSESILDNAAAMHCDKWLEKTGLHMSLYAGAEEKPIISDISIKNDDPISQYRDFSGDVSGVIGEAIFAVLLTKFYKIKDNDFLHFGATKATGVFPDFGIYKTSHNFEQEFFKATSVQLDLPSISVFPAEVKAMANPNITIVQERLQKAVIQLRSFWSKRKSPILNVNQKPSLIFMAMRNSSRQCYDGVKIWMV